MNDEQKKIRRFYKEFLSWRAESVGYWIGAGICVVFLLIFCAVPFQFLTSGIAADVNAYLGILMAMLWGPLAGLIYLRPYTVFLDGQNYVTIYSRLRYLPIDTREVKKMRFAYLTKFFGKVAVVGLVLQVFFSLICYHVITWQGIVYVVIAAFVWPMIADIPVALSGVRN